MTKKERYKELIKENNNVLNALSDDYRKVGYNYVKKARGYAVKSLDTEIRIKEVLEELTNLSRVCKEYHLPLFVDGARLGYGMVSQINDVWMSDLANLCDVFYIGGTKVGALFGEAVVITNDALKTDFRYFK